MFTQLHKQILKGKLTHTKKRKLRSQILIQNELQRPILKCVWEKDLKVDLVILDKSGWYTTIHARRPQIIFVIFTCIFELLWFDG